MPDPTPTARGRTTGFRLVRQPVVSARILQLSHFLFLPTRLSTAESKKLQQDPDGTIARAEDNKRWCTLRKWLEPKPAEAGGVLCRRSGLSIRFDRAALPNDVNLLAFDSNSLQVELRYSRQGAVRAHALQPQVDHREKRLTLVLPFDETPEGRNLYDDVLRALSTRPGAQLHFAYAHTWQTKATRPPRRTIRSRSDAALRRGATERLHVRAAPAERQPAVRVMPGLGAWMRSADRMRILAEAVAAPPGAGRQPPATESREPEYVPVTVRREFLAGDIFRESSDQSAYPDLLRFDQPGGWAQFSSGSRSLYYKASPKFDTFLYLPTQFRLGYFVEPDGLAGLPPVRVSQYQDADGRQRFTVALVAIPHVPDADREALRTYLRDVVLSGQLPYVRLEQAGGLTATFDSSFTAGGVDDRIQFPAGIASRLIELDISDRLVLEFDMAAELYGIFCEILLHGLRGSVQVNSEGLQRSIPVRLDLGDIGVNAISVPAATAPEANGLFLWQEGERVTDEDSGEPVVAEDAEDARLDIVLKNNLEHPVHVASVSAHLLDTGAVPGTIWDAEAVDLQPSAAVIPGRQQEPKSRVRMSVSPSQLAYWDETVVQVGALTVQGGTPDDWLHRVLQDPSLRPAEFLLRIDVRSVLGIETVQALRLRVVKLGEPGVRQEREIAPGAGPVTWPLLIPLNELAGMSGPTARFALEYDAAYLDGRISLPQRVPVELTGTELLLQPVVESPDAAFAVEPWQADGTRQMRESLTRQEASALIQSLAGSAGGWRVYVTRPTTGPVTPDTDSQPDPSEVEPDPSASTGTPVTLVSDLLRPVFENGSLLNVFVILQADADDAPQTTLTFSPERAAPQIWQAAGGTVPPFRYKITYLFADGRAVQTQGVEQGVVLLLDPSGVG
jgi:hypothetical protein